MIRYYLVLIVTFLSLNSFGQIIPNSPLTAVQAEKEVKKFRKNNLFNKIDNAASEGNCFVDLPIETLPKDYSTLLTNFGYKLEYYEFKKEEHISWCD